MPLDDDKGRLKSNLGYAPPRPLSSLTVCGRCSHTGDIGYVIASSELAIGGKVASERTQQGLYVSPVAPDPHIGRTALNLIGQGEDDPKRALSEASNGDPKKRTRQSLLITQSGQAAVLTGRAHHSQTAQYLETDIAVAAVGAAENRPAPTEIANCFNNAGGDALLLSERLMSALRSCSKEPAYRSAALRIVDETFFPVVDLRVDNDPAPIERLAKIYGDYMRDDVKLDAYLPSKEHPTGFAPSSIDETLRWVRRYYFKIREAVDRMRSGKQEEPTQPGNSETRRH